MSTLPARRPCPFCRHETIDVKKSQGMMERYWCLCLECRARGPEAETKSLAIYKWNAGVRAWKLAPVLALVPKEGSTPP